MAIVAGDIIRASDVSAALATELGALSVALAKNPYVNIFTDEISSQLWTSKVKKRMEQEGYSPADNCKYFLENLGNRIVNQYDDMMQFFNVLPQTETFLSGYGDMVLSGFALASNIRNTEIYYGRRMETVIQNGMYLKDDIISRNLPDLTKKDIKYNQISGSTEVFTASSVYWDKFKDKQLDGKKITDLSGNNTPLSVGRIMRAEDAMNMIHFLSSMTKYINDSYPCSYGEKGDPVSVIYHESWLFGDGNSNVNAKIVDECYNGWKYTFRKKNNCGKWKLQGTQGTNKFDRLSFYGWTTNKNIVSNPTVIGKNANGNYIVSYTGGQTVTLKVKRNPNHGNARVLDLYPVCHGYIDYDLSDSYSNTSFHKSYPHKIPNIPAALDGKMNLYATFKYFFGFHNERNHTHKASMNLMDRYNGNSSQTITYYTGRGSSYQCFYIQSPNHGTVTSEFKANPFQRTIHGMSFWVSTVLKVKLKKNTDDGKWYFDIWLNLERSGSEGKDDCSGYYNGLRVYV